MVSGSRGQVVSDRPESGQGVVEADGVLGHRPRRQLDADRPGLEVDVQHLPVNPQGQHDLPVREWHPQLMPVMAARHAGVETAGSRERVLAVGGTGQHVPGPAFGHYLFAGGGAPVVEQ